MKGKRKNAQEEALKDSVMGFFLNCVLCLGQTLPTTVHLHCMTHCCLFIYLFIPAD